jgi:uncharacterized membrane protein
MLRRIAQFDSRTRLIFDLCVMLAIAVLVTVPIFVNGIPGGNDMPQHFQFAQTFFDSIRNGYLYPSWADQTNFGYGDVSVRFYPPLTYYLLSFFRAISGDWFIANCLLLVSLFFISGVGVYRWAREWFPETASLVGGIAFILLPYHVNQIYGASLIAEFAGAAVIPFCFLYATRVCRRGSLADICGLAAAFALLLLTHLPTSIMACVTLFVYCLATLKRDTYLQGIAKLGISVFWGLIACSFYWVRMASELDLVKHSADTFSTDYFSYKTHFVFLKLIPFMETKTAATSSFLDNLTLISLIVVVPFLVVYFIKARESREYPITNVVLITALTFLMTTPLSVWAWDYLPLLHRIQFPWRWLIFFALGSSMIIAAAIPAVIEYAKTPKRFLSMICVGALVAFIPYNVFNLMNPLFTYPQDYFNGMVERFKTYPSFECWWTSWAQKDENADNPYVMPRPKHISETVAANGRATSIEEWLPTKRRFTIHDGEATTINVATLYYPHWKVKVNGSPVEVTPSDIGLISFAAPSGDLAVDLYFEEPRKVIVSFYLSAFAWLLIFSLSAYSRFGRTERTVSIPKLD